MHLIQQDFYFIASCQYYTTISTLTYTVKKVASAPDDYPDIAGSISGYSWTKESGQSWIYIRIQPENFLFFLPGITIMKSTKIYIVGLFLKTLQIHISNVFYKELKPAVLKSNLAQKCAVSLSQKVIKLAIYLQCILGIQILTPITFKLLAS